MKTLTQNLQEGRPVVVTDAEQIAAAFAELKLNPPLGQVSEVIFSPGLLNRPFYSMFHCTETATGYRYMLQSSFNGHGEVCLIVLPNGEVLLSKIDRPVTNSLWEVPRGFPRPSPDKVIPEKIAKALSQLNVEVGPGAEFEDVIELRSLFENSGCSTNRPAFLACKLKELPPVLEGITLKSYTLDEAISLVEDMHSYAALNLWKNHINEVK